MRLKLLVENVDSIFFGIGLSKIFSEYGSSGKGSKSRNKQMEVHQAKGFYTVKEIISQMKRLPPEWEKMLANT